jgi:O-methyltransferase
MQKAILFGAGFTGVNFYNMLKDRYDIVCATDNDKNKYGKELAPGILIRSKDALREGEYDCVIISTYAGFEEIEQQLIEEFGVDESRIVNQYVEPTIRAKYTFLETFSKIAYAKNMRGAVCEAGVYRGGFAKEINRCFPDRKLYLFDTFDGYDRRDVEIERQSGFSAVETGSLSMTSEEIVLSKMPFPENCIIKKGYFPETFDLYSQTFCFVNIDFDLYKPVTAALSLFYPRLSPGGIILLHDYMWSHVKGAAVAVDQFVTEHGLGLVPIGDGVSVAIVKDERKGEVL